MLLHQSVIGLEAKAAFEYIGVKPDLYDPIEEKVKAYLRGEDVDFGKMTREE